MARHSLDIWPIPKEKAPLFINEPWIIDSSLNNESALNQDELQEDNIRAYLPLDINRAAILRRLRTIIAKYGEANEENEVNFQMEVDAVIAHIEIYDQIWYVRNMPPTGKHSAIVIELVRDVVSLLKSIPDGCAEIFPFETIEALEGEFLVNREVSRRGLTY